ncbi:MAG: hypothetical protein IPI37_02830, partial [Bacteroidales bacterium]|nr:hypothetical protein [Bacteroidales bacterium]
MLYFRPPVPVPIITWAIGNSGKGRLARERFSDASMLERLSPDYSPARMAVKFIIRLGLHYGRAHRCRPQFGSRLEEAKREG